MFYVIWETRIPLNKKLPQEFAFGKEAVEVKSVNQLFALCGWSFRIFFTLSKNKFVLGSVFHHFCHRRPGWEHRPGVADYWFFFGLGSFGFSTSLLLLAVIRFRIIVFYRFLFFGLPSSLYWQHRRFRIFGRFWFWSSVGFESVVCYHRFLRHKQEIGFLWFFSWIKWFSIFLSFFLKI